MLDLNGDGQLELDEYKYLYRIMDLNLDGTLTLAEISAWFKSNEYGLCRQLKDTVVVVSKTIDDFFKFLDADNSGSISSDDV